MEPLLASELDSLDLFLLEKFLRVRKTIVTIDTREMEQAQGVSIIKNKKENSLSNVVFTKVLIY